MSHSAAEKPTVLVGVDVGGTFTDAVVVAAGRIVTAKRPTTPDDQSEAVVASVLEALDRAGLAAADVERFAHGMTVGTNALLEGSGAPIALVTTEGFADVVELRRQDRAHLYRLDAHHPPAIVPADRRFEVRERCGPDGVVVQLDSASVDAAVAAVAASGVEAAAVGLLFSFAHPEHEQAVVKALRSALPHNHLSAS
jgi:N-methylhydantoinase A